MYRSSIDGVKVRPPQLPVPVAQAERELHFVQAQHAQALWVHLGLFLLAASLELDDGRGSRFGGPPQRLRLGPRRGRRVRKAGGVGGAATHLAQAEMRECKFQVVAHLRFA